MNETLRDMAHETRALYRMGEIDRKEAQERLRPYVEYFNARSAELAEKYNQKPKRFNFAAFMR